MISRDPADQQRGRHQSRPSTPRASTSTNRPKTQPPPRSKSHGDIGQRTPRPHLTVVPSNGTPYVPATPVKKNGTYTYVIQSPVAASPVQYRPSPPQRHATTPHSPHAHSKKSHSHSSSSPSRHTSTPTTTRRPAPHRSATSPHSGGVMYNGKLIVGDPADVERYVNSQKSVERWARSIQ